MTQPKDICECGSGKIVEHFCRISGNPFGGRCGLDRPSIGAACYEKTCPGCPACRRVGMTDDEKFEFAFTMLAPGEVVEAATLEMMDAVAHEKAIVLALGEDPDDVARRTIRSFHARTASDETTIVYVVKEQEEFPGKAAIKEAGVPIVFTKCLAGVS